MVENKNGIDVNIMGRSYHVPCTDDEREGLLEAIKYLNEKINEMKAGSRATPSAERILLRVALNLAHELLTTRVGNFDVASLKRRIGSLQSMLDEAIAPQEKLF